MTDLMIFGLLYSVKYYDFLWSKRNGDVFQHKRRLLTKFNDNLTTLFIMK